MVRVLPAGLVLLGACAAPGDGLHVGQNARLGMLSVTPLRVVSDSRCPAGVTCIWAGTVVVDVRVTTRIATSVRQMTLDKPIMVDDRTLTLVGVTPAPIAGRTIASSSYRFSLRQAAAR